jgi:hypothetical protein
MRSERGEGTSGASCDVRQQLVVYQLAIGRREAQEHSGRIAHLRTAG